jgi:hypothetical protein
MQSLEDIEAFTKMLGENGFTEQKKGSYSNGEVTFIVYGLGPYKVNVRRKMVRKTVTGEMKETMQPSSLEKVFDMLPKPVSEYIIYTMDSFRSEHIGWVVHEKIGIGIINTRGLGSLDIRYK